MLNPWNLSLLLDQVVDFQAMGQHFRAESATINIPHLFVLAIVVLVIASSIWALSRWQESDHALNVDSPQKLFLDLCKAHQLSGDDTSLLRKIGRELQLPQPASLFIDPSLLISAQHLEKFHALKDEVRRLGEDFFGYHLWKQAQASHGSQL